MLAFIVPPVTGGGGWMPYVFGLSVGALTKLCDVMSLFSGTISMKFARNIHHLRGEQTRFPSQK